MTVKTQTEGLCSWQCVPGQGWGHFRIDRKKSDWGREEEAQQWDGELGHHSTCKGDTVIRKTMLFQLTITFTSITHSSKVSSVSELSRRNGRGVEMLPIGAIRWNLQRLSNLIWLWANVIHRVTQILAFSVNAMRWKRGEKHCFTE